MAKLSPEQITEKLKALPGWERKGETIAKQYTFKEFMDGIRFINRIAEIAEQMDHHPDITVNYRRITFSLARMTRAASRRRTSSWATRSSASSRTRRENARGRGTAAGCGALYDMMAFKRRRTNDFPNAGFSSHSQLSR